MKKELSRLLRHQMTMLALFLLPLLAIACGTQEVGMEGTVRDAGAQSHAEILVTRDVDAQAVQPAHASNAVLGDGIRLLGYDYQVAGQTLNLALYWQASEPVDKSYNVFIHVLDSQGELQGQADSAPVDGGYPTALWQPGEVVVDGHKVSLPSDVPLGSYKVATGSHTTTGTRCALSTNQPMAVAGSLWAPTSSWAIAVTMSRWPTSPLSPICRG